jgi:rifampicin phosphotransferase
MTELVRWLQDIRATDLGLAGGKGANLGELVRANFPVPDGFVLTTDAYAQAAAAARVDPHDPAGSAERLRTTPVAEAVSAAAIAAYATLSNCQVAVRSSATAEDLPGASFAGQQDTYLNIVGREALLDAIRRCWASLWNERAVAYRGANNIDPAGVSLAVVIQKMVAASAAGVLFTADPLTGRRRRAVIDAIPELGERLVSGAVDPDHYVVDTPRRAVVERKPAGSSPVLSDGELVKLVELGEAVERHFGTPQDIEFALDADRGIWLVQSRPITTLYPLPPRADTQSGDVRVYFSANVFQGYFEPLTPMGIQFFCLLGAAVSRGFGAHVIDPLAGPAELVDAGLRLFVDVTPIVRDPLGRRMLTSLLSVGEARSAVVLSRLTADLRQSDSAFSEARTLMRIAAALLRVGVPQAALPMVLRPITTRVRYEREVEAFARINLPTDARCSERLDAFERLLLEATPRMLPRMLGIIAPAVLTLGLAHVVLRGVATPADIQMLTRSAPRNPTTEMDLALWALSVGLRADGESREALLEREPSDLASAYVAASLPNKLQTGVATFLARYGFRSIGEIDIGVKRWSEDPTHILGVLANYVRLQDASLAPDVQFARGQREAEAKLKELLRRVRGPRRLLVSVLLHRMRALIGGREAPKYHIIRLLVAPARELLQSVGRELAAAGRLSSADDIFLLTLPEARRAVAGADMRDIVVERRRVFERERARRHIPRVLLSDGTDAEVAFVSTGDQQSLRGSPASPGVVSGPARVIRSPLGARLEPGEILVAPSTDPGWTPLFLTAGGLVMEMGGMMSHGAVVAREYGIPAVVGVTGATDRISTGQRITVDGGAGSVSVAPV